MNSSMLVYIGEPHKLWQRVQLTFVKSLVRLKGLEALHVRSIYIPKIPVTCEVSELSHFWILDVRCLSPGWQSPEVNDRQLPHQVIESRAQIMNSVPNDE